MIIKKFGFVSCSSLIFMFSLDAYIGIKKVKEISKVVPVLD